MRRFVSLYDIEALVDNELNEEEEKRVRTFLEQSDHARRTYETLCRQKMLLRAWWGSLH